MPGVGISRTPMKVLRWVIGLLFRYKVHLIFLILLLVFVSQVWQAHINLDPLHGLDYTLFHTCQEANNVILEEATEIHKVVGAAATTLMTLLPALLVFGPFPTAEVGAMIPYSTAAALITSGFTLGLATSSLATLGKNRILRVVDLCTEATISAYGMPEAARNGIPQLYTPTTGMQDLVLPLLATITPEQDIVDLHDIMTAVLHDRSRCKRFHISFMNLVFMLIQGCLLALLLGFAPDLLQINMVWICYNTSLARTILATWIASMILIAGLIRTFAQSSFISHDEILHLSPVTPTTAIGTCEYCSLAAAAPPARVRGFIAYPSVYIRAVFRFPVRRYLIHDYLPGLLRDLFMIQNTPHPMVVILRAAADDGRHALRPTVLLFGVLRGFVQALFLIGLTILFGSTFDSGIMQAAIFVTFFMAVMVSSRTNSIYYCLWMQRAVGTTVIEYRSEAEMRAIKVLLYGMPFVVVDNTTDGAIYSGGFRVDQNLACGSHASTMRLWIHRGTVASRVGVAFVLLLLLLLLLRLSIDHKTAEWEVAQTVYFLYILFVILFAGLCIAAKVIAEFAFLEVHRGAVVGRAPHEGPGGVGVEGILRFSSHVDRNL